MRIEKAKELLLQNGCSVSETSEQLGFENPYYFSRVFKKQEGVSPREFVKVNQTDSKAFFPAH